MEKINFQGFAILPTHSISDRLGKRKYIRSLKTVAPKLIRVNNLFLTELFEIEYQSFEASFSRFDMLWRGYAQWYNKKVHGIIVNENWFKESYGI